MEIVPEDVWDALAPLCEDLESQPFRDAVGQIATKAKEKLPESSGRIEAAVKLILAGHVTVNDDGSVTVGGSSPELTYTVVDGTCPCKDDPKAPHSLCKHRLASAILRRAQALMRGSDTPPEPTQVAGSVPTSTPVSDLPSILLPYIVHLHGKPFVQYSGLLLYAQSQGLISLVASLVSVTPELALAKAVARFKDGRRYQEGADATPANVGQAVRLHFPRIALTRAKARVLRDALVISAVSLEELGDEA
jgi:hypothetical protein